MKKEITAEVTCAGKGSVFCPLTNQSDYKEVVIKQL